MISISAIGCIVHNDFREGAAAHTYGESRYLLVELCIKVAGKAVADSSRCVVAFECQRAGSGVVNHSRKVGMAESEDLLRL